MSVYRDSKSDADLLFGFTDVLFVAFGEWNQEDCIESQYVREVVMFACDVFQS